MVNFSSQLAAHMVASWEKHYIDFRRLKEGIRSMASTRKQKSPQHHVILPDSGKPGAGVSAKGARSRRGVDTETDSLLSLTALEDDELDDDLHAAESFLNTLFIPEVAKVESFYLDKTAQLRERFARVEEQANTLSDYINTMTPVGAAVAPPASIPPPPPSMDPVASSPPPNEDSLSPSRMSSTRQRGAGDSWGRRASVVVEPAGVDVELGQVSPGRRPAMRRPRPPISNSSKLGLTDASLREAYTELYQTAKLLFNYHILNYTGFLKIAKKFDKQAPQAPIGERAAKLLASFEFPSAKRLNELLANVEASFARRFTDDNVHIAKTELLVKRPRRLDWGLIELGTRLGVLLMLVVWFCWDVFVDATARPTQDSFHLKATVPVFRALGCIIILGWLWLFNVTVFHNTRINYVYVLDCDVRTTKDRRDILRDVALVSIVFMGALLLYFKTLRRDSFASIPPSYFPMVLFGFVVFKLVHPWRHRQALWQTAWEVVTAPLSPLTFRHGFVADIFTSMVKVWADLAYTACFFVSGEWLYDGMVSCHDRPFYTYVIIPLVHSLPLWWRFMQTLKQYRDTRTRWPFLGNSFKYAFAQSVIMFGVFKPHLKTPTDMGLTNYQRIWIATFVCSTLYSFWWDVVMDWGLGRRRHGFLRETLMFSRKWVYWVAIAADFFLRFCWTFSLIPTTALPPWARESLDYWALAFLSAAELFRRSMWACFRLEWEHLSTTGGQNLVPLQFDLKRHRSTDDTARIDGKRVLVEATVFVAVVLIVSVTAAAT